MESFRGIERAFLSFPLALAGLIQRIKVPGKVFPLARSQGEGRSGDGWQEGNFPSTPANPTAYKVLKLGDSMEIEVTHGFTPGFFELEFKASHVVPAGFDYWGQSLARVSTPRFERQEMNSVFSLKNGEVTLVGTVTPEPMKGKDGQAEQRVWFAFVTVSKVETK